MMDDSDHKQYKSIKKGAGHRTSRTNDFTYEHFPVVCPSCEGTGTIEEDAGDMVTFVPVKDERLRPAWTKLKILLLILVILTVGACATYFLYPRAVTIQINAHSVTNFDFYTNSPWIQYNFIMNVTNNNFFAITLKQLTMQLLYVGVIVSNRTFTKDYNVRMRTVKKDVVTMNASYDCKSVGKYVKNQCFKSRNYVPQLMVSFAELSYWMHTEHIQSKDDYFYTDCAEMVFPLPTKPNAITTSHKPMVTTTPSLTTGFRNSTSVHSFTEHTYNSSTPKESVKTTSSLLVKTAGKAAMKNKDVIINYEGPGSDSLT